MSVAPCWRSHSSAAPRQSRDDIVVIDGIEAAKLRRRRAKGRIGFVVDLGENPPGQLAILAGEPALRLDKLEMRIELAREHGPALGIERRRKARLILIEKPGDPAKAKKVSQPLRRNDFDLAVVPAHRPHLDFVEPGRRVGPSPPIRAKCSVVMPGRRSKFGGVLNSPRSAKGLRLHAGLPASPRVASHP